MRSFRQVPNLYFGQPGKQLQVLPWPVNGMDAPYERQTFDFLTGSGLHQVSSLAVGSRQYNLNWEALHVDTFALIEQYRIGTNGPGPFVLIDPSAPNLLPANAAAATGVTSLPNPEFSASSGSLGNNVLSSYIHRPAGWASLRWTFASVPPTFTTLDITPQFRNWYWHPCVVGLPYAFSSWVTVDGTIETNATVAAKIAWYDAAGTLLGGEVTSGDTAITTWTKLSVTGTAPANAAYMRPYWVLLGTSMAAGGQLFIDEPLLEQDTAFNTWAAGSGIRPVEIVSLTGSVPFDARFRTNVQLSLRELAR